MSRASFAEYKHDMDELGASAASIIKVLRRQRDDAMTNIARLVAAAGGSVTISTYDIQRDPPPLKMSYDPAKDVWTLETK